MVDISRHLQPDHRTLLARGAANSRLTYRVFLGRNRQYVTASESFLRRFPPPRHSIRLAHAMGACWIVGLAYALYVNDSETMLVAGLAAPILCWTVLCFGYIGVEYVRMFKKIPLPGMRHASLERRSLKDYVNPRWAWLAYALIALVASVYVIGYLNDRVPAHVFIPRMAGLTIATVTGSLCLIYSLRRKNQPIDDELGPIYRKIEVIGIIPLLLLIAPIGGWRILQDFYGVRLFSDLAFFAVASVVVQAFMLYFICHPGVRRLASQTP